MDTKAFISDFERHVKNITEDQGNWNGDHRKIGEYDKSVLRDLEDYLKTDRQNTYADKNFAREVGRLFSDDNYALDDYIDEIEKEMPKLWKLHGEVKNARSNMPNDNDSKKGLMGRFVDAAVDDGTEIATRLAAKQLSRAVAEPVTAMLISGLGLDDNESVRGKIAKFLNSDVGLGLVSFALSFGVKALPLPALAQGVVEGLGRELRLQGEMAVADPIVEMVGVPMRAMLTEKVLALPAFVGLTEKQLPPAQVVNAEGIEVKEVNKADKKQVKDKKSVAAKKTKAAKKNDPDIKVVVKNAPTEKQNEVKV